MKCFGNLIGLVVESPGKQRVAKELSIEECF